MDVLTTIWLGIGAATLGGAAIFVGALAVDRRLMRPRKSPTV